MYTLKKIMAFSALILMKIMKAEQLHIHILFSKFDSSQTVSVESRMEVNLCP
jgi:hypothetical protein